ncbi:MAG: DoxX family protein [Flavobacteriales bacterium]|nr:DoxX family protein [Flavobacteriales bacterium]
MNYLLKISRLLVGNLFIFSGIVKANDPLGFSYKLDEYFVEFGMTWSWLHDILVPLATFLVVIEIVLGVAVLVGYRMKEVSWSLLLMIVFFTFLTGASAIFEIVRSCGCFGDAIPLTPWDSFVKDLILLFFILIIFIKRNSIQPFEDKKMDALFLVISSLIMVPLSIMLDWWAPFTFTFGILAIGLVLKQFMANKAAMLSTLVSLVASITFSVYAIEHLPFADFRPYAINKNLPEQMTLPPNAKAPIYENILTYKNTKTGEVKDFTGIEYNNSRVWEDKDWEWQNTESKLIEAGDEAKITDLTIITHDDEDITDLVLAEENSLWIVCYDLSLSNESNLKQINDLAVKAKKKGMTVHGFSSAGREQKDAFIKKNKLDFDFLITDGIVLKTMVRSNPGIMQLKNGTVVGKWHENDIPTLEELK